MVERNGLELPVPLVFLSNRGFSGSFVFSVGADRRSRRKRNGREAGYFRLNKRNRQFESISLHHPVRLFSDVSENRSKFARVRGISVLFAPITRIRRREDSTRYRLTEGPRCRPLSVGAVRWGVY
jgi:hypothetical protein